MQIGITTDGLRVFKGLGRLYFEQGIPLEILFIHLKDNGIMPSWIHLYSDLYSNGMSKKRIIHLLHENMYSVYGEQFTAVVLDRLDQLSS